MNTTPKRISKIDELVISLVLCAAKIDTIRLDREEVNATLAMCEIAVNFPPAWFTREEQILIHSLIEMLFGDSKKFVEMISDESLSYYAKACQSYFAETGCRTPSLQSVVEQAYKMHFAKFGAEC